MMNGNPPRFLAEDAERRRRRLMHMEQFCVAIMIGISFVVLATYAAPALRGALATENVNDLAPLINEENQNISNKQDMMQGGGVVKRIMTDYGDVGSMVRRMPTDYGHVGGLVKRMATDYGHVGGVVKRMPTDYGHVGGLVKRMATDYGDSWHYEGRLHVVDTPGCHLPAFHAKSKLMLAFTRSTLREDPMCATYNSLSDPDFKFGSERPPLFESGASTLHAQLPALERYGIGLPTDTYCFYSPIFPEFEPYERDYTTGEKYAIKCKGPSCSIPPNVTAGIRPLPLVTRVRVPSFINQARVFCFRYMGNVPRIIYNDFVGFAHQNYTELRTRCKKAGTCDKKRRTFNVMIIGVDAGSRLNSKRNLVQTHDILTNLFHAVELRGYNSVSNSSMSSFTSVTAGMTLEELRAYCWQDADDCPDPTFLWEVFGEQGFATAFVEDKPTSENLREDFGKFGTLRRSAVDNFGSPFIDEAVKAQGHTKISDTKICAGPRHTASMVLKYGVNFMVANKYQPYFGVMWLHSATNDDMNALRVLDQPLATALREMHSKRLLERTIVVVIAGHGSGGNNPGFKRTFQGKSEMKNPFSYIYLPKTFRDTYPAAFEAVKNNAWRLVTPFDMHKTLLSLADPIKNLAPYSVSASKTADRSSVDQQNDGKPVVWLDAYINGKLMDTDPIEPKRQEVNLFDTITANRTCLQAGVPANLCMCARRSLLSTTIYVDIMAKRMMEYMNYELETQPGCETLQVEEIVHAEQQKSDDEHAKLLYLLRFSASPGKMLFEGTLVPNLPAQPDIYNITITNMVTPPEKQSHCIQSLFQDNYLYFRTVLTV